MAPRRRPPGADAPRGVRRALALAWLGAALLAGACALGPPPAASFERAEDARREGELEAAVEGYTRAIAAAEARRQFDVLFVATAHLADLYVTHPELGREREGVNLWRRVLRQSEALFGADHPMTASAAYELGHAYVRIGDTASAEPVFARSVAILRAARPDSAETRDAENAWRGVRRQLGMEPELPAAPSPAPAPKPEGASDGPGAVTVWRVERAEGGHLACRSKPGRCSA